MTTALDDRVMNAEQRKLYMFERKVPKDVEERERVLGLLQRIIIHNGYHTAEVQHKFRDMGIAPELYYPEKSTEPHFFDAARGNLHVVNSRGEIRLMRDFDLVDVVRELVPHLELQVNDYNQSPLAARSRFREFAYKKVGNVFGALKETGAQEIMNGKKRVTLLFGPHVSLPEIGFEELAKEDDDYLNFKVLMVGDEPVVSFDYIFADQARYILEQMCFLLNVSTEGVDVHVFHYGKVGLLDEATSIGQLVVPNGSLDEKAVISGLVRPFPVYNRLLDASVAEQFSTYVAQTPYVGKSVNTISVLQQRRSHLERAKAAGGSFLDMEWGPMAGLVQGFPSSYPRIRGIELYFAGIGSDKPLEGATLGETKYPRQKEKAVVQGYLQMIKDWR